VWLCFVLFFIWKTPVRCGDLLLFIKCHIGPSVLDARLDFVLWFLRCVYKLDIRMILFVFAAESVKDR